MKKPTNLKGWVVFALGLFFMLFGLPMLIGGILLILIGDYIIAYALPEAN